jgi:hypothetical protein
MFVHFNTHSIGPELIAAALMHALATLKASYIKGFNWSTVASISERFMEA